MPRVDHQFIAMGGPCRLQFDSADQAAARRAVAAVEQEVHRLESKYSRYRPGSLVSRINRSAGSRTRIAIDEETAGLLGFADTLWQQSGGLFDLSAGILRRAWDFNSSRLPSQGSIDELLPLIGWDRVDWDSSSICLPRKGMEIDFGGIVKEYACDGAAARLAGCGVARGLIDLAGDMAAVGPGSAENPWQVGIRHPRDHDRALAGVRLARGGLASSGDYARCVVIGERRYGHILNPRTGWPVSGLAAVSVLAGQCLVAGGGATVAMLKPEAEALQWLAELGLPWLAVDSQMNCHGDLAP